MSRRAGKGALDNNNSLIRWWNGLWRARRRQARSRRRRGPAGPGFTAPRPPQRIGTDRQCRHAGAVPPGQCGQGSGSADFKHVADLPVAARCGLAASFCTFDLPLADVREDGAEVIVLDDRRLRNLPQLVEGGVGQVEPTVADRQPAGRRDNRRR
jgi:hypothetical protein